MKYRISLSLLLWTTCLFTCAQSDHFLIGIWSFSYDNAASGYNAGINTRSAIRQSSINYLKSVVSTLFRLSTN